MEPNLETSPPDSSDAKAAFCKSSNDTSNRRYRHRTPVSGLSSSEGSSPRRDRSVSPMVSRDDPEKSADTRPGRDGRELDRDSTRNRYSRNGDSYRYSNQQPSRSSYGSRHDKHGNEDRKYDRFSSHSDRKSRIIAHSDHPRQVKSKLFSLGDEKRSSLEQAEETVERVAIGHVHSSDIDITNDVNAAKVAAMKAAELVNRNLSGAGHSNMTTEQKKKLLWGRKKSIPAEESGHRWDTALFGDRERQVMFNKLMGVKGDTKVEHKADDQDAEKQCELQLHLEQYTAGLRRRDGRTVGLGL
ncbi:ABC transporter B family member 1-like [Hibiscus syriacus]|uniref:ABC transporter B family member 1-like n=1 Tax=Hibiscus syriacus TaxID=106335 RepID=A0A6A3ACF2_HIBSY|nr:arginine/serine-rich coiled-coil protein 2-like isoform X2 [Hibiscus syriacus]KAE8701686.1 ABC transporter B family member 1-like [Hibiscus syriacus]